MLEDTSVLLSLAKLRGMLEGRVAEGEVDEKARALLDATAAKRLASGQTVVIALESLDAIERERYVRAAPPPPAPAPLILVEAGKATSPRRTAPSSTRCATALDAGEMGQEGFVTSLRLGGRTVGELKRIVFAPPPEGRLTAGTAASSSTVTAQYASTTAGIELRARRSAGARPARRSARAPPGRGARDAWRRRRRRPR